MRGQWAERTWRRRRLDVGLAVTRVRAPAGGNGGKARGRARGGPVTAWAPGGQARGGRVLVRRQPWLRCRRGLCGRMARGRPPPQPAGHHARPRRPGSAAAPRPSASPRTPCGPAKADMALPGARSGPARWSAPPQRPGRREGGGGCEQLPPSPRLPRRSQLRAALPLQRRHPRHSPPA